MTFRESVTIILGHNQRYPYSWESRYLVMGGVASGEFRGMIGVGVVKLPKRKVRSPNPNKEGTMKKFRDLYEKIGLRLAVIWSNKGQTTIEYVLVLVLIVLVIVLAFASGVIENAIDRAVDKIASAID